MSECSCCIKASKRADRICLSEDGWYREQMIRPMAVFAVMGYFFAHARVRKYPGRTAVEGHW